MDEFQQIVEFSYHLKDERFVVRFLDGSSYILKISSLPKKLQTKKPKWEESFLSEDRSGLLVRVGKDLRVIPSHVIHSKGEAL